MIEQDARNKARVIYDLIKGIYGYHIYYWEDGSLNFSFKSKSLMNCRITPVENKYKIKIYANINIATTIVLYEVDGIEESKLNDTFHSIVKYLDNEWMERDKGTWWGYSKGKEINYDDHGRIISVS